MPKSNVRDAPLANAVEPPNAQRLRDYAIQVFAVAGADVTNCATTRWNFDARRPTGALASVIRRSDGAGARTFDRTSALSTFSARASARRACCSSRYSLAAIWERDLGERLRMPFAAH